VNIEDVKGLAEALAGHLWPRGTGRRWSEWAGAKRQTSPAPDPSGSSGHNGDDREVKRTAEETWLAQIPDLAFQPRLRPGHFICTYHPSPQQPTRLELDRVLKGDRAARYLEGRRALLEQRVFLNLQVELVDNDSPCRRP
jgi:hypothetical protein